jgi:SAM-dependent methyltransferase
VDDVCPACGASGARLQATLAVDKQHAAYFPNQPAIAARLSSALALRAYQLMACGTCGLVFAAPMTSPGSAWYALAYEAWNVKPEHRWEYDAVLAKLGPAERVYEIGCGTGAFLLACRQQQIAASGVDFWPDAIARCRDAGLEASVAEVSMGETPPPSSPASAIASFHVLEHLQEPRELFRHAATAARDGAALWISVPSYRRPNRLLGYREPMDEPPHHLTQWTDAAFAAIGRPYGWELTDVWFEPFSLRGGLFAVASHFRLYQVLEARRWLGTRRVEQAIRALLYPVAAWRLRRHPERQRMTGLSMLVRYRRVPTPTS